MRIEVFEPAMCCSTGVCSPGVDPDLARFAGDLQWLSSLGVEVARHNLAAEPQAFADSEQARSALAQRGEDALPLIVADGLPVSFGVYPSREALARWSAVSPAAAAPQHPDGDGGGCCAPGETC